MREILVRVGLLSVGLIVGFLGSAIIASNKRAWLEARLRSAENIMRLAIKVIGDLCLWDTIELDELSKEIDRYEEDWMSELKLRLEVKRLAEEMEKRLRENDHKGGWKDCDYAYLTRRLQEEINELHVAVQCKSLELIKEEAADIANFAMMIADNFGGLMEKRRRRIE